MKTTITFREQDKPLTIDNIQIAQQRVPMYIVAQGDTRYRFALDTIEKIVEEGVMSEPADVISASETDTAEQQADVTRARPVKTPYHHTGAKKVNIDLSKLEGKLDLNEGKQGDDIRDGYSKGEIASRIQEILDIGQTQGYKIVDQLIAEKKIRRTKHGKGWGIVDPVLDYCWVRIYEDVKTDPLEPFKGTLEEFMLETIKEDFK